MDWWMDWMKYSDFRLKNYERNGRKSSVELDNDYVIRNPGKFSAKELIETGKEFLKDPSKMKDYCNY